MWKKYENFWNNVKICEIMRKMGIKITSPNLTFVYGYQSINGVDGIELAIKIDGEIVVRWIHENPESFELIADFLLVKHHMQRKQKDGNNQKLTINTDICVLEDWLLISLELCINMY